MATVNTRKLARKARGDLAEAAQDDLIATAG